MPSLSHLLLNFLEQGRWRTEHAYCQTAQGRDARDYFRRVAGRNRRDHHRRAACGRDEGNDEASPIAKAPEDKPPRIEDFSARRRVSEALLAVDRPMPTTPAPASSPVEPAEPMAHRIHVQVAPPTESDPGAIVEGSFTLTEDVVLRVYDTDQNLLGTERLKLGEDPARVAWRLLRKKQGNGFDRRIEYPNLGIV
jgi:hypothetical protein